DSETGRDVAAELAGKVDDVLNVRQIPVLERRYVRGAVASLLGCVFGIGHSKPPSDRAFTATASIRFAASSSPLPPADPDPAGRILPSQNLRGQVDDDRRMRSPVVSQNGDARRVTTVKSAILKPVSDLD